MRELVRLVKKGNFNHNYRVMPIKPGIKPYKHQVGAFLCSIFLDRVAFFMEPGTGKTLPMIASLGYRYMHNQCKRVIIFCPLTVASELERQFHEFAGYPHRVVVMAGMSKKKRDVILDNWEDTLGLQVIILNYENSWDRKHINHGFDKKLSKWKPDAVVCDESQRLKNGNSTQTRAIRNIVTKAKVKIRMILTGTPISESPLDIFGQYKFLEENIFGMAFTHFKARYVIPHPFSKFKIMGYQRLKELSFKTHRISYQALKRECLDLPPVTEKIIHVELEPKAMLIYREMLNNCVVELKKPGVKLTAELVMNQQALLAQMTGGYVKYHTDDRTGVECISSAKMNACVDKVVSLCYNNKCKKVVVFAKYVAEVEALVKNINKAGVKAKQLSGSVKQQQRKALINEFQTKPKLRVMVVQIATGGVGITLTAADTEVFYSRDYRNELYEQAKARVDRLGQKNKVTIYHIVAKDTVDTEIAEALVKKQNVVELFLEYYGLSLKGEKKMKRYHQEPFEVFYDQDSIRIKFPKEDTVDPQLEIIETSRKQVVDDDADLDEVLADMQRELDRAPADRVNLFDRQKLKEKKAKKGTSTGGGKQSHSKTKSDKPAKPRSSTPVELTGDTITLKQIAEELNADAKKIRQWLRKDGMETKSGKWVWEKDDPQIQEIIDRFPG